MVEETKTTTKKRKKVLAKRKPAKPKKTVKPVKKVKAKAPSVSKKPKPAKAKKPVKKEPAVKKQAKAKYIEAVGRRKTAMARVRLYTQGAKEILINEKPLQDYFQIFLHQQIVTAPLEKMKCLDKFRVSVKVRGGGVSSQAGAVRHGIARCLLAFNPDFRKRLKKAGYLTRDARMRERKKFGLKRARKAAQWSKR